MSSLGKMYLIARLIAVFGLLELYVVRAKTIYLLNSAFGQQVDVLIVWIVVVFGGFGRTSWFFLLQI